MIWGCAKCRERREQLRAWWKGQQPMATPREPKTHNVKCDADCFAEMVRGDKTAELRKNDRDYMLFDTLKMHEMQDGTATGRTFVRLITHIVRDSDGPWLAPGYCMLSLGILEMSSAELERQLWWRRDNGG